jgi:hypothetical protein
MSDLRKRVIRLANENPELRPHLLPLLRTKKAGTDIYSDAMGIVSDGFRKIDKALDKLRDNAAKTMKRHGFEMVPGQSYLEASNWGSDGSGVDGQLMFKDTSEVAREEPEVQRIFDDAIGAWPSKVYGKSGFWQIYFGK